MKMRHTHSMQSALPAGLISCYWQDKMCSGYIMASGSKKEAQVMNTDKKTTLQINTECNKVKILPILNLKGDDNLIQGQNFFHCCYSCTKL